MARFLDLFEARVEADAILLAEVDRDRRERALALFRRLAPRAPRLSFTDCTSFAIMRELGIELAFTPTATITAPALGSGRCSSACAVRFDGCRRAMRDRDSRPQGVVGSRARADRC